MKTDSFHKTFEGPIAGLDSTPTLNLQLFTEPEAAQWLKVSRITLQRIRLRGEIAFSRIGGTRVIYTVKHLMDYVASRERASFH